MPTQDAKKVLLVVHQQHSDPGRVGLHLRTHGYHLDIRRPPLGDELPEDLSPYAGAVVFGGPMSANDDHEAFIRTELDWIPKAVASGKPFLGICLGAQLLARSLGARVKRHPEGLFEIGYFPVQPSEAGQGLIDPDFNVFQWHNEGFELPAGADLLATGERFPNQAFRYGRNAWAIQFHPEVTEAMNRCWTIKAAHRLAEPGAQSAEEQLSLRHIHDGRALNWLHDFLPLWLASGADTPAAQRDATAAE